jgi:hypothetical protein
MKRSSLQFNVHEVAEKARRLARSKVRGVSLSFPFVSVDLVLEDADKRIAREVLLRLRDKRVLVASECCDSCARSSLSSIQEIRRLLVDKQVELADNDGPLFLVFDLMLLGIRQFLTHTESLNSTRDRDGYFAALQVLREHLLRCVVQIARVSGTPPELTNRMPFDPLWAEDVYIEVEQPGPR